MDEYGTDQIAPDEDIDVMHEVDHIRIERLSDAGLYVAGYTEGAGPDYRYWLSCQSDGEEPGLHVRRSREPPG